MRALDIIRGRYRGPYFTVTARRWWSRQDRHDARLSLRIMEDQAESIAAEIDKAVGAALIGGVDYSKPTWSE